MQLKIKISAIKKKIKDDIEVDLNEVPPVIKYVGKGGGDPIVIATINIR